MEEIKQYYDAFSAEQVETGVNKRHRAILGWVKRFGVKSNDAVLEVGCGIGTFTSLLATQVRYGKILAVDISPKSIDIARQKLSGFNNITLLAADITFTEMGGTYDVIILPDVLEHIPIDAHTKLFAKLATLIKPNGYILIHIPNPYYLEWCKKNTPELLQIIDQPLYTNILAANIYQAGLYIHYLETYSVWIDNCDHQVIVVKPCVKKDYKEIPFTPPPLHIRLVNKIKQFF